MGPLDPTLRQALTAALRTHAETVHNLNNADTPGFEAQITDFKSLYLSPANQGFPPHGDAYRAYVRELMGPQPMDADAEMARLSQASLEVDALTRLLNGKYARLRQAIWEGKR